MGASTDKYANFGFGNLGIISQESQHPCRPVTLVIFFISGLPRSRRIVSAGDKLDCFSEYFSSAFQRNHALDEM